MGAVKKIGRPRTAAYGTHLVNVTFRATEEMRDRLGAMAAASKRSLSEVVETSLERHFTLDEMRQIVREEIAAAIAAERA